MRDTIHRFFIGSDRFAHEFWQEVKMFIIFGLGFTIAFTWRQTIFDTMEYLVQWITNIQSSTSLSILTSVSTTIVCLILIFLTAKFFQDRRKSIQNNQKGGKNEKNKR